MTSEQYLELQEKRALRALRRATSGMGQEVRSRIDIAGAFKRHPLLFLGAGAAAGFLGGKLLSVGGRSVAGRLFRVAVRPLFAPTVSALGTAISAMIIGGPFDHEPGA